jgi:toxin ParE1/3/4
VGGRRGKDPRHLVTKLIVTEEAEREAAEAARWYEENSPGVGDLFLSAIRQALARIEERPLQFPRVRREIRRARLVRFPYCVFYRMDGETVRVVAIIHDSRDPRRWQRR